MSFPRYGLPGGTSGLGFQTILPEKRRRGTKAEGGLLIIRTNAAQVARDLGARRLAVQPNLLRNAKARAADIQARMQAAALVEYSKTGTGRFARGIKAQVSASTRGGRDETVIKVSSFNYREARFLTNIGGGGYFKRFPVKEYDIWAKGARRHGEELEAGKNTKAVKRLRQIKQLPGVGRLKVPRRHAFFTASRKPGRGGGESRVISDIIGPIEVGDKLGGFFFYPVVVTHPGFRRDVISDIARDEGAKFVFETSEIVGSNLRGTREGGDVDMVVSDEIPLTRIGRVMSSRTQPERRFT